MYAEGLDNSKMKNFINNKCDGSHILSEEEMRSCIQAKYVFSLNLVYDSQLLENSIIELTNAVTKVLVNGKEEDDAALQNKIFLKLLERTTDFTNTRRKTLKESILDEFFPDNDYINERLLGNYSPDNGSVFINIDSIRKNTLNAVKGLTSKEQYKQVEKEMLSDETKYNFKKLIDANKAFVIHHELLHALKSQYVNSKFINGFYKSGLNVLDMKNPNISFERLDETINEYHNLILFPDLQKLKSKSFFTTGIGPFKKKYSINEFYMYSHKKIIRENIDVLAYDDRLHKIVMTNYFENLNIVELFEILVGRKELLSSLINDSTDFYNKFNDTYRACFEKYKDITIKNSPSLQNILKNITDKKMYIEKHIEPLDLLAYLINDSRDYKQFVASQEYMQVLLIECLIKKISETDIKNMPNKDLNKFENYIKKDLLPHVKDIIILPIKTNERKLTVVETAYNSLKTVCSIYLAKIEKIKEKSSEQVR